MAAKRKAKAQAMQGRVATRRRKAPPPPPPPPPDPWWKHGEGISKAGLAMVAALGMLGTAAGFIYRHFTAGEEIPPIKAAVAELKGIHKTQEAQTRMKAYVYEEECKLGKLAPESCRRLGYPHPEHEQ